MLGFFSLTLFVSATLLFFVQPMIGKMILPRLGGTPAVWNTCMVFFQAMLLVGYGYTHTLSTTQNRRTQLIVQAVLLFVPLFFLPFALGSWVPPTEDNPIFPLLGLLLAMVGLPFVVVATTAPLLQKWFATTGHPAAKDPYFLYGASNFGSMLGLLAYPAVIEWMWDVPTQAVVWTVGYAVFIALVLGCAYLVWRTPEPAAVSVSVPADPPPKEPFEVPPAPAPVPAAVTATAVTAGRRRGLRLPTAPAASASPAVRSVAFKQAGPPSVLDRLSWVFLSKDAAPVTPDGDRVTIGRRIRWVLLAAAPSSLMLGVTTYLTTDIAAVPFFWVIPLALYLLTFILVFAKWPVVWTGTPHTIMLYLQPCFLLFLVLRMVSHLNFPYWPTLCDFALNLAAFFSTTLVCHGELAKDRPSARHLTEFYLWMSFGGVLGGMFNALVAPLALPYGIIEYPLAMVVACVLRPYMVQDVSEARNLGIPRRPAQAPAMLMDSFLMLLGMTTYNAAAAEPQRAAANPVVRFVHRFCRASNLLEILLDLLVPLVFAYLVYLLLDIGDNQRTYFGITFRRSYMMAVAVVLALAMAMRPVRFGLSVGALFLVVTLYDRSFEARVFEDRGFFGLVRVREIKEWEPAGNGEYILATKRRTLIHGGINHGQQIIYPEPLRREPITYFHPTNGIGEIFHKLTWGNPPGKAGTPEHKEWMERNYWTDPPKKGKAEAYDDWERRYNSWYESFLKERARFYPADARMPASVVGLCAGSPWAVLAGMQQQPAYAVVGLGAGTLAVHAQPFQWVDFYEIDPIIKRLSIPPPGGDADDLIFYYVDDALKRNAQLDIKMGDGRLRLAKDAPDKYYHAMLIDAFSSDAVPVHLLTKEAVQVYLDKLADGGVLIFNTTNRYVDLPPVLARIAEELNLECLHCPDYSNERIAEKFGADWLAMRRRGPFGNGGPSLYDRLQMTEDRWRRPEPHPGRAWTDGYSNLLSVMRW